mmetsp:Transcript_9772/g.19186  ORF Transcript_9772/g.19186 Transcript_9772/m.19186 type:complete len:415 (-) Transcript_9772:252-1496(-)|eukprot:CAMPEP_0171499966 /NCGR_PEP_ID=MMETSP0958-20121227/8720_1 /TAXON_ID=87120 /ORGANISM="Aurantiochytrium limacinum, Strain ATCCMYA-1381" /LENGTH=414 /DNA_ID=CAMNT_0012034577 /DNA_START=291 /DNA_END=1535 /DNA_ORIENTATION=-
MQSETGPGAMLAQYKEMVRAHPEQVKRMEEIGRLVTMLVPTTRFGKYSEVFQESTYAGLSLVSLYHSRIIHQVRQTEQGSALVRVIKIVLTLLGQTEIVIEMLTRILRGDGARQRIVLLIEWIKAIGRLILFMLSKRASVLVNGGQLQPLPAGSTKGSVNNASITEITDGVEESSSQKEEDADAASTKSTTPEDKVEATPITAPQWAGRRSGKAIPLSTALASFDNVHESPLVTSVGSSSSKTLVMSEAGPEDQALRTAGEILHIIRPVIYIMQVYRLKDAKSTWRPWALSLILELLSLRCSMVATPGAVQTKENVPPAEILSKAFNKLISGSSGSSKASETDIKIIDDEMRRRRTLLAFYFMRSPLFERVTLPAVRRFAGSLSHLPGIGNNIEKMLVEMIMYYHRNHFHISGS